jgi:SAM-dependent methyltransferase
VDPDEHRRASLEQWERSAAAWGRWARRLQEVAAPVSHWMVRAIDPQPGQTVLELAAGPGETGFLAAELLRPGGKLICSDFAEGMLEAARGRAAELGLDNVEFRRLDAESLDLDTASVDAALCRWGYMLMADPAAALRETRRVLRPGGRLALAAWDCAQANPWAAVPAAELRRALEAPDPDPDEPGMFTFAPPGRVEGLLLEAGFAEPVVEKLEVSFGFLSFEDSWEERLELSKPFADGLARLEEADRERLRDTLRARLAPYGTADGGLDIPGRALVAAARA